MKVGDKFRLYCDHEGCKRFIVMELWCESMGTAHHPRLQGS